MNVIKMASKQASCMVDKKVKGVKYNTLAALRGRTHGHRYKEKNEINRIKRNTLQCLSIRWIGTYGVLMYLRAHYPSTPRNKLV